MFFTDESFLPLWVVFTGTYLRYPTINQWSCKTLERDLVCLFIDYLGQELYEPSGLLVNYPESMVVLQHIKNDLSIWADDLEKIDFIRNGIKSNEPLNKLAKSFYERIHTTTGYTLIPHGLISTDQNKGKEQACMAIVKFDADTKVTEWLQINPGSEYHPKMQTPFGKKSAALLHLQGIDKSAITLEWLTLLLGLKSLPLSDNNCNLKGYYKNVSLYECLLAQLNPKQVLAADDEVNFTYFHYDSPYSIWQVISQTIYLLLKHYLHPGKDNEIVYYTMLLGFKHFLMKKFYSSHITLSQKKQIDLSLNSQQHQRILSKIMSRVLAMWALDYGKKQQVYIVSKLIEDIEKKALESTNGNDKKHIQKSQFSSLVINSLDFLAPKMESYTKNNKKEKAIALTPIFPLLTKKMDFVERARLFNEVFFEKIRHSDRLSDIVLLKKGLETFFLDHLAEDNCALLKSNSKNISLIAPYVKKFSRCYQGCQIYLSRYVSKNGTYDPSYLSYNILIQFFAYAFFIKCSREDELIGPWIKNSAFSTVTEALSFSGLLHYMVLEDIRWEKLSRNLINFFSEDASCRLTNELLFDEPFFLKIENDSQIGNKLVRLALKLFSIYKPNQYKTFLREVRDTHQEKLNQRWKELISENLGYLPPLFFDVMNSAFIARASLNGLLGSSKVVEPRWSWAPKDERYSHQHGHYAYWQYEGKFYIDYSPIKKPINNNFYMGYVLSRGSQEYQQRLVFMKRQSVSPPITHCTENRLIATQHYCTGTMTPLDYVKRGSVQSQPLLKIERLYIAIKTNQLDFSLESDVLLMKQTLFEQGHLLTSVMNKNLALVNGILAKSLQQAIDKRLSMTQHHTIGGVLTVIIPLLKYYISDFHQDKQQHLKELDRLYDILMQRIMDDEQPLQAEAKMYICAYAIVAAQCKTQFNNDSMCNLLLALITLEHSAANDLHLSETWKVAVNEAICKLEFIINQHLTNNQQILNAVIKLILPNLGWNRAAIWTKPYEDSSLFQCGDYSIKPLLGKFYFQGNSVVGLPHEILTHSLYCDYFGKKNHLVMPTLVSYGEDQFPGYQSIDAVPSFCVACIDDALILAEWINEELHYLLSDSMITDNENYPEMLKKKPKSEEKLRHWRKGNEIIIKTSNRESVYRWDLIRQRLYFLTEPGYLVSWENIEKNNSWSHAAIIDSPEWTAIIADDNSDENLICRSIHYLRLGLDFFAKKERYFSRQIHGYFLSKKQHINTLDGFHQYWILEAEHTQASDKRMKILIPHYEIIGQENFFDVNIKGNYIGSEPAYFIYDIDERMGLLKAKTVVENLYLALLYLHTGSLDENNIAHCQSFILANEYLKNCWQISPYSENELNIFKQLLMTERSRNYFPNRLCLILRALTFLIKNESLHFLFENDEDTAECRKVSKDLVKGIEENKKSQWVDFFKMYLCYRTSVLKRLWLTREEEKTLFTFLSNSSLDKQRIYYHGYSYAKEAQTSSGTSRKAINVIFHDMFNQEEIKSTNFKALFDKHLHASKPEGWWVCSDADLNFGHTFREILTTRFRVEQLISLYKMAKENISINSKNYYFYFLHHMVLRSKNVLEKEIPYELLMLLSRALLLVAKYTGSFQALPSWCAEPGSKFNLKERALNQSKALADFPEPSYPSHFTFEQRRNRRERELAENNRIWGLLKKYDLDYNSHPNKKNYMCRWSALDWESHIYCDHEKKQKIRDYYFRLVKNNLLYDFFSDIMLQCDKLKNNILSDQKISKLTLPNASFSLAVETNEKIEFPISLKLTPLQTEPLVNISDYFSREEEKYKPSKFPFIDDHSTKREGYYSTYFRNLMDSWDVYEKEIVYSYNRSSSDGVLRELRQELQMLQLEYHLKSQECWQAVEECLTHSLSSEDAQRDFLKYHSGLSLHYLKIDILRLLVEPNMLVHYNTIAWTKRNLIYSKITEYISYEIRYDQIERSLVLLTAYETPVPEIKKKALFAKLLACLQERLNKKSFKEPYQLLFQLENHLLIRSSQQELLETLLNGSKNSLYQLNMGEGKSSVILPLLCHALEKKKSLLHIVVLEPLFATMYDLLYQRLSGMVKKQIYTLPFFRDTNINEINLDKILWLIDQCQRQQGLFLLTPEHQMCLELKKREVLLEYQNQHAATNLFNWHTYRDRHTPNTTYYANMHISEKDTLLERQDTILRQILQQKGYLDKNDAILKAPIREGSDPCSFTKITKSMQDANFHELSCIKAAYFELTLNSVAAYTRNHEVLKKLETIMAFPTIKILDESDEILRHATELNYTLGEKQLFSGGDYRWKIAEWLLTIFFENDKLMELLKQGIETGSTEVKEGHIKAGGVPFVRLLDTTYFNAKIQPVIVNLFFKKPQVLEELRKYKIAPDISIIAQQKITLRQYVTGTLSLQNEKTILHYLEDKTLLCEQLQIARGWMSFGLFFHVFNMKYRARYGLIGQQIVHKKIVAVPFVAKDTPTHRSEFSHPDVMIGATLLSYLYEGLTLEQLYNSLHHLQNHYAAAVVDNVFLNWFNLCTGYPESLTEFKNLDLSDKSCMFKLHQHLSKSLRAVFYYLNYFVFPKEAYQYPYKISSDAHHLAGFTPVMGFSGTDDRKITLPFTMKAMRTDSQRGTNGKLLKVLTAPRNSRYISVDCNTSEELLDRFCEYIKKQNNCYIIIDAGALITGLTNRQVAEYLLERLPRKFQGVIFFTETTQRLEVLMREKKKIVLLTNYRGDKELLFAYLDDAHTRGTDLLLPLNAHGLLTIGIDMEKDKLMQAAMRLRQLAEQQSLSFWGTQKVTHAICRDVANISEPINSIALLKWVCQNTVNHIDNDTLPVALRMLNFEFLKYAECIIAEAPIAMARLSKYCQEAELFGLVDFYGVSPQKEDLGDYLYCIANDKIRLFWKDLCGDAELLKNTHPLFFEKITDRSKKEYLREIVQSICRKMTPYLQVGKVKLELSNDQEKQIEVEIIQEKKIVAFIPEQTPAIEKDWDYSRVEKESFIDWGLEEGVFSSVSIIARHVKNISLADIRWHPCIYITNNYLKTIENSEKINNYLRPVDMILLYRDKNESYFILLSGYEAACLKKLIKLPDRCLLIHLDDVNGLTQQPINQHVSKKEQKEIIVIKLFAGHCYYKDKFSLAKCIGRMYPEYLYKSFTEERANIYFEKLIRKDYLTYNGVLELKMLNLLSSKKEVAIKTLMDDMSTSSKNEMEKLWDMLNRIRNSLIFNDKISPKTQYSILWQWASIRGAGTEYRGSVLEEVLQHEFSIEHRNT